MLLQTKRQVFKIILIFGNMRCFIMFVTAVCVLFLLGCSRSEKAAGSCLRGGPWKVGMENFFCARVFLAASYIVLAGTFFATNNIRVIV